VQKLMLLTVARSILWYDKSLVSGMGLPMGVAC
jgi:hypothetical protein